MQYSLQHSHESTTVWLYLYIIQKNKYMKKIEEIIQEKWENGLSSVEKSNPQSSFFLVEIHY